MSSKKKARRGVIDYRNVKYINNTAIEDYVSEDPIMSNSLELIKDILIREKCKDNNVKFSEELALNLDKVESERQRGTSRRDNTVDFVVGLGNKHLLLIEAKFGSKNMENIASDIHKKIKHSKELLVSNPNFVSLYDKKLILLDSNKFEQNKRKLMNLLHHDVSFYPATATEFYSTFFDV